MHSDNNGFIREFDRLYTRINELYHEIAVKQGLSDSAYSILQAVNVLGDGCTQTDVYKYCGLNKQTVNSSVNKLRANGILESSPGNGREIKLFLTDSGKEIVAEKILPIEEIEKEVYEEMTQAERDEILRLTEKYLNVFRDKLIRGEKI